MKKKTEIILNIVFWVVSIWLIIQVFGMEAVEVELVEDVDFNETVIDGISTQELSKTTSFVTRDDHFTHEQLSGIAFKALLFYLNILVFLPNFFKSDRENKLNHSNNDNRWNTAITSLWDKISNILSPKIQLIFLIIATIGVCLIAEMLLISSVFEQSVSEYRAGLNLSFYIFYLLISLTYGFIKDWYRSESHNVQLKEEKLITELNFLKSQINPHFLFNILNNLYSLAVQTDKQELSTGISELSHLMRYMVYESNVEKIAVEKEVIFLRNMINLSNLSYSEEDDIDISFEVKGVKKHHLITPVILIPFVENAFKHGIDTEKKSFIKISLEIENDGLNFEVANSIHKNSNPLSKNHSGIGLSNVRKRLNLLYPERHKLSIQEEDGEFKISLSLIL